MTSTLLVLAFAGVVALWGSAGMISAIDRLPLVPGVLELVGSLFLYRESRERDKGKAKSVTRIRNNRVFKI
jgi:hypothetical protein